MRPIQSIRGGQKKASRRLSWLFFPSALGGLVLGAIWVSNLDHMKQVVRDTSSPVASRAGGSRGIMKHETKGRKNGRSSSRQPALTSELADKTRMAVADGSERETPALNFHIVFSTGCNAYQDWQSYVMFHQVWKSGQTGNVTRIAACANKADSTRLQDTFDRQVRSVIPTGQHRFHLHITPDYSASVIPGLRYKFFNKPYGLRHWMEHGLGLPGTISDHQDTIIIILDPDQMILRPFTSTHLGADPVSRWKRARSYVGERGGTKATSDIRLERGRPVSQIYAFGSTFAAKLNANMSSIVQAVVASSTMSSTLDKHGAGAGTKTSSHLYNWTRDEIETHYAPGPPYLAYSSDMYRIVQAWADMVAPVYTLTTSILSEMYAYSAAAAHVELPHHLGFHFMISMAGTRREGWDERIDNLSPDQVCIHATSDETNPDNVAWRRQLPHVLHYCQHYDFGPYSFFKKSISAEFLSCEHPLLPDPTLDNDGRILRKYNSTRDLAPKNAYNLRFPQRDAFLLCHLIARLNEAAIHWKQQNCPPTTANFGYAPH